MRKAVKALGKAVRKAVKAQGKAVRKAVKTQGKTEGKAVKAHGRAEGKAVRKAVRKAVKTQGKAVETQGKAARNGSGYKTKERQRPHLRRLLPHEPLRAAGLPRRLAAVGRLDPDGRRRLLPLLLHGHLAVDETVILLTLSLHHY